MAIVSTPFNLQTLKRTPILQGGHIDELIWRQHDLALTQELVLMHNLIQSFNVSGMAMGVALAAVVLPAKMAKPTYAISAMGDWLTTFSFSAQTVTGFTLNFGTITPLATNNVLVTIVG